MRGRLRGLKKRDIKKIFAIVITHSHTHSHTHALAHTNPKKKDKRIKARRDRCDWVGFSLDLK